MVDFVQICGLKRSGTYYLARLLGKSFNNILVSQNTFWGKHEVPENINFNKIQAEDERFFDSDDVRLMNKHLDSLGRDGIIPIVIFKNPFSWVNSFQDAYPNHNIERLVERWNNYHQRIIKFIKSFKSYRKVQYEILLKEKNHILQELGFLLDNAYLHEIRDINKRASDQKDGLFDKSYYLEERYMDELSSKDKKIIRNRADFNILRS